MPTVAPTATLAEVDAAEVTLGIGIPQLLRRGESVWPLR
jgi:hypothetical protein